MSVSIKELCKRLKEYRINYPMTQQELADRSGVSVRSISRFENSGDITLSNFIKLLETLKLSEKLNLLIPDQSRRPSYFLNTEKPRQRATSAANTRVGRTFKWGDEQG